jgi:hypothetical protein
MSITEILRNVFCDEMLQVGFEVLMAVNIEMASNLLDLSNRAGRSFLPIYRSLQHRIQPSSM